MVNDRLKRIREQQKPKTEASEDQKALMSALGEDIVDVLYPLISEIAENSKMNKKDFKDIMDEFKLGTLKVQAPEIKIPAPDVKIPHIKLPVINVPAPKVNVTVPEVRVPTINVPTPNVNLPERMSVVLDEINRKDPLPVLMVDDDGKPMSFSSIIGGGTSGGGKSDFFTIKDIRGSSASIIDQIDGAMKVTGSLSASLSADTGSGEIGADTLRIVQATDAVSSVQVKEIFGSTVTQNVINADNRIRCSIETGGTGLTDAELRASSVPVAQVSGAIFSTEVKSGVITSVTDITNSVATALTDSTGEQYSGSNPVPVGGTVAVSGITGSVGSYLLDADGDYRDELPVNVENTVTVDLGANNDIQGDVAHDSADSGNPVKIGGKARTTNPTAVANGDRVDASFDDIGRQMVRPVQARDLLQTAYVTASSEGPKTLLAGAGGVYHDLVYLMGANESDASVNIDIMQSTGGTVQQTLVIPANSTAGLSLSVPIPQDHSDATWQVDNNSADDSNTTYSITALFSKEN